MRRSKVALLIFAGLVAIAALVLGLYFGLAHPQGPQSPDGPGAGDEDTQDTQDPLDPKEMARLCALSGVTATRCAEIVGEYGMEGTASNFHDDLRQCRLDHTDPAQVQGCILDHIKRFSPFNSVFEGSKSSAVYPQNYASLTLSVDSLDLALGPSNELALVASGAAGSSGSSASPPLEMRFVLEGARHSIRTADGKSAVYVATNGVLSIGDVGTVARALFDVRGTGAPNTLHVAPVERSASKLLYAPATASAASAASAAPSASTAFVTMRLDRRNGLAVDVALDGTWFAASEYGWHRAFITASGNASCCNKLMGGCSPVEKSQFPLCCSFCNDTLPTCAWKASIDAGVDARVCCFSSSTLPNEAIDYNSCRIGTARADPPLRTLQYALKCDPTPDHTFAFVPPGVWDLAPLGVRLPAYGRVAQMRIAGAGFRGVRCSKVA